MLAEATSSWCPKQAELQPLRRVRDSIASIEHALKPASAMLLQHADTADVTGVAGMRRRHDTGKGNRYRFAIRQPPVAPVEWRNRRAAEERQTVQVRQGVGDVLVLRVDLADPGTVASAVSAMSSVAASSARCLSPPFLSPCRKCRLARAQGFHRRLAILRDGPLHGPAGTACAGDKSSSATVNKNTWIIFQASL